MQSNFQSLNNAVARVAKPEMQNTECFFDFLVPWWKTRNQQANRRFDRAINRDTYKIPSVMLAERRYKTTNANSIRTILVSADSFSLHFQTLTISFFVTELKCYQQPTDLSLRFQALFRCVWHKWGWFRTIASLVFQVTAPRTANLNYASIT